LLQELLSHNIEGAAIGHFALGEYIYAGANSDIDVADWMQIKTPEVLVKFPISQLVSRRTFIFARAGFGKSNLNKLLFSELYRETPAVPKRGDRQVPVGTLIFDPDGEYFWPDDRGRPGLCDVPHLRDKLVVFTNREGPSRFYESFVAGGIKLDIRQLKPSDVISLALSPERQEQQNVRKLRGLRQDQWEELVDLIAEDGNQTDLGEIKRILNLDPGQQDMEALAARGNMTAIVGMIHDKRSQLMDKLLTALSKGKLCVVDVSQLRGSQSLILSSLILRRIFDRNQEEFTKAIPSTIPTIAVVEEAQSVLNERSSASEPYIAWVKEGRKYDLGAVLITQQPGSISHDILSQGDNWFIFHLLSAGDLVSVNRANAHFSEDILSSLLNEPIPGQGVFWSSAGTTPFPIAIRALSFEQKYKRLDLGYDAAPADTYAGRLKATFEEQLLAPPSGSNRAQTYPTAITATSSDGDDDLPRHDNGDEPTNDPLTAMRHRALALALTNQDLLRRLNGDGLAWGGVKAIMLGYLPEIFANRDDEAYRLAFQAVDRIALAQDKVRHDFTNERTNKKWVKLVAK
jgi:hypothetical protein